MGTPQCSPSLTAFKQAAREQAAGWRLLLHLLRSWLRRLLPLLLLLCWLLLLLLALQINVCHQPLLLQVKELRHHHRHSVRQIERWLRATCME